MPLKYIERIADEEGMEVEGATIKGERGVTS